MAINFPSSPSVNQTFTVGSITYKWDGDKWIGLGVTPADRLVEGSNSLEINASNDLVYTAPGTLKVNSADASGYIAEFNQTNTSNSGQILINSPTDGESRPVLLDMARAGNVQWSLGQGYLDTSDAFRISTTSLSSGFTNSKVTLTTDGDVGIGENSPADRLVVQKTNASGDVGIRIKNDTTTDGDATNPTTASLYLNTSTSDFNTFYIQARRNDNDTHFGYSDPRDANHVPTMVLTNEKQVLINTTIPNSFNGVGSAHNLVVVGETSDTDITDNSSAAITISNRDGTAFNTAGLHFAREDNDGSPHYCGASIVAQFKETQVTGQYPKADLVFLTSIAANNAPSEKMRVHADGNIEVVSGSVLGKFYASNTATLGLTEWTASVGWRVIEVFGKSNPNNLGSNYMDPIHVYLYHGYGWNGSALTSYLYLQDQAPLARSAFPSGSGGSANQLTVEWFDGTTAVSGATGVAAGSGAYYPRLTTAQMGTNSNFQVRVIRRF